MTEPVDQNHGVNLIVEPDTIHMVGKAMTTKDDIWALEYVVGPLPKEKLEALYHHLMAATRVWLVDNKLGREDDVFEPIPPAPGPTVQ